jgi:DNA-binding GntR family transcriptional regulator
MSEYAYQVLRDHIMSGELPQGSAIDLNRLSARLGISKTPLRESLLRLEAEGLIQIFPRRHAIVTPLSTPDLLELYRVRQPLERLGCELIVSNVTDTEVKRLEELLDEANQLMAGGLIHELRQTNREFHRVLYGCTRNKYLTHLLDDLREKSWRYIEHAIRLQGKTDLFLTSHAAMIECVKLRDVTSLVAAVQRDMDRTVEYFRLYAECLYLDGKSKGQ